MKIEIHKSGGILLKDRKILVARSKGKDVFAAPGGKIEESETAKDALIRELNEEFGILVQSDQLTEFGTFFAQAAGDEDKKLKMDVFIVKSWSGEIKPDSEIEEILWVDSEAAKKTKIGSIFAHDVIPKLKERNLID